MSTGTFGCRSSRRGAVALPVWLLVAAVLAAMALAGGWARVGAQGTPEASPAIATGECTPATGDAAMIATPAVATPAVATPEASPVAEEEAVGSPADADTAEAVVAAAENVFACYATGDVDAFLGLVTDNFIVQELGFASRDEATTGLTADIADVQLTRIAVDAESVVTYDDGRHSVDVVYTAYGYQWTDARWFFVESGADFFLDEEEFLRPEPEGDQTIVAVDIADDETPAAFAATSPTSVPLPEVLILQLKNDAGTQPREFRFVLLPEGTAATPVAEGATGSPSVDQSAVEAGTTVGSIRVDAGGRADLALVGLQPGTYALVDEALGAAIPLTLVEATA